MHTCKLQTLSTFVKLHILVFFTLFAERFMNARTMMHGIMYSLRYFCSFQVFFVSDIERIEVHTLC